MTIQFEVWQLATLIVTLGIAFLGFVFAAGRLLLTQIDQRLDQRFAVIEGTLADVQKLEKDFLRFQADLPLQYVRREDYVRNQTVLEAKLDALAVRIENLMLQNAKREGGV